jgi:hypothetical protein
MLEYCSLSEAVAIRMPSTDHGNFAARIETEIALQLIRVGMGDGDVVGLAHNIENLRSATLHVREFDLDPEFSSD